MRTTQRAYRFIGLIELVISSNMGLLRKVLIDKPNKGCTFVEARYTVPVQLDCAESIWFVYQMTQ